MLSSLAVPFLVFDLELFAASSFSGLAMGSFREDAVLERVALGMFVDLFWRDVVDVRTGMEVWEGYFALMSG